MDVERERERERERKTARKSGKEDDGFGVKLMVLNGKRLGGY
jgi:hypothetical protein